MPPVLLVIAAVSSVQFGAALAKSLFDELGSGGTVFVRVLAAAIVLALIWPPRVRGHGRRDLAVVLALGLVLAGMNSAFYASIDRIPLGAAVTFEFVGPLGVAVAFSRKAVDLLWVLLAGAGILLLADFGGGSLDTVGIALALVAGVFWGAYILLTARIGQAFPGATGLTLAMIIAVVPLAPAGIAEGGANLLAPSLLAIGAAVGILSTAVPQALELEALRHIPTGVFGVLMSLEPGIAALAGYLLLDEGLVAREVIAILLVVVASAGAAYGAMVAPRD